MSKRLVSELPVVLTSFAYRREYFAELKGMLATVEEFHPDWTKVIGLGPVADVEGARLAVVAGGEAYEWTLPVPLRLDGENDWRLITRMKAWWIRMAWNHSVAVAGGGPVRLIWLDADARLNGRLDFAVDPEAELIASPWYIDKRFAYQTLTTGLILLQGRPGGMVSDLIDCWSADCLRQIEDLRAPIVPWLDGDQEVLTENLAVFHEQGRRPSLIHLDYGKYCGCVTEDGERSPGALVDQWMMSWRMKRKEYLNKNWPPPEEARRYARAAVAGSSNV
jgi:hypothetical protein